MGIGRQRIPQEPEVLGKALSHRRRGQAVATDAEVIQIHRDHRDPEIQSVLLGRFSALTDSAEVAQGRCARG